MASHSSQSAPTSTGSVSDTPSRVFPPLNNADDSLVLLAGLDENVSPSPSYPSESRVLEAMALAAVMGATTIRSQTLGVSYGTAMSVENALNETTQSAFAAIDWAVFAAKSYGLRLVLPLTDQQVFPSFHCLGSPP